MRYIAAVGVGFLLGVAFLWGVFLLDTAPPPAPELRPATAVRLTLHPCPQFVEPGGRAVDVPPAKLDRVMRLLTPESQFVGGPDDRMYPLVAEAEVTHPDGSKTMVWVRWAGANPAAVSLDGRRYFYAVNHPEIGDGGLEVIRLVNGLARDSK